MSVKKIEKQHIIWTDIEKPNKEDVAYLRKNFQILELDLKDILVHTEMAKVDLREDYIFIILRFPVYNRKERTIIPSEIDIFIKENYFITVHRNQLKTINEIFDLFKNGKLDAEKPHELLYTLLKKIFRYTHPMLDHIAENVDSLEKHIFKKRHKKMVEEISIIRRNIIDFYRMVKPQHLALMELRDKEISSIPKRFQNTYFDDLTEESTRLIEELKNHRDTVEVLHDTNKSLMNNTTQKIILTLTMFSAIFLPMTLITSIYSMNLQYFPFQMHMNPLSFWFIILGMAIVATILFIIFKAKKWL
ncbi:MAG: hypothetical protein ACD_63C00093G0002 [uncultured bacterium]|nr:MAG: hypothetical protein ACD_63C00093G0002 [uncultured bacterium]